MLKDYTVSYRSKDQKTGKLVDHTVELEQYCKEIKFALTGVLLSVEKIFASRAGTMKKDLWPEKDKEDFMNIRRDILNAANNVERLPYSARYKNRLISNVQVEDLFNDLAEKIAHKNK